jgi:hypothetical protein
MLDKVTPEMKKLGEGALPYDGGLYPVRSEDYLYWPDNA